MKQETKQTIDWIKKQINLHINANLFDQDIVIEILNDYFRMQEKQS